MLESPILFSPLHFAGQTRPAKSSTWSITKCWGDVHLFHDVRLFVVSLKGGWWYYTGWLIAFIHQLVVDAASWLFSESLSPVNPPPPKKKHTQIDTKAAAIFSHTILIFWFRMLYGCVMCFDYRVFIAYIAPNQKDSPTISRPMYFPF